MAAIEILRSHAAGAGAYQNDPGRNLRGKAERQGDTPAKQGHDCELKQHPRQHGVRHAQHTSEVA